MGAPNKVEDWKGEAEAEDPNAPGLLWDPNKEDAEVVELAVGFSSSGLAEGAKVGKLGVGFGVASASFFASFTAAFGWKSDDA